MDTHYTYSHENVCWHLDWDPLDPREGALEGREASEEAKEGLKIAIQVTKLFTTSKNVRTVFECFGCCKLLMLRTKMAIWCRDACCKPT